MINRSSYRINLKLEEDANELLETGKDKPQLNMQGQSLFDFTFPERNHISSTSFLGTIINTSYRMDEEPRNINLLSNAIFISPSNCRPNPFILTRNNGDN
jgi:hypothetical protein